MESGRSISTYTLWPPVPFPTLLSAVYDTTLSEKAGVGGAGGKEKGSKGGRKGFCACNFVGSHTSSLIYTDTFMKCHF